MLSLRSSALVSLALSLGAACGGGDAPPDRGGIAARSGGGLSGRSGGPFVGGSSGTFGTNPGLAGSGPQTGTAAIGAGTGNICASALVQASKNMPTIVFVIDGSGSMCAPFGGGTRWQALRSALLDPMKGLVYRLQNSVSFGATLYDGTIDLALALTGGGMSTAQNPPCALGYAAMKSAGTCPGLVEVMPPKRDNAAAIDQAYPQTELGGSTPTDKALSHVMDALIAGVQVQGPDQKAASPVYVILATDGAPNDICVGGVGGDGSPQRQGVLAAVDRGAAVGITTWVISLADGDPALQVHLDEVAKRGDPKNAMARTFNPMNPDDLIMTLAGLLGGAVGCNISLNGTVTVGQECAGAVELNGKLLPCCQQTGSGWSCDGQSTTTPNGWRLTDPRSIELIGDSCTQFLIGSDESLMATFPCEVFRPG